MPSWVDLPFASARDYLLRKKVVHPDDFAALYAEERGLAFTVTGVNRLDVLQHVLDSVAKAVGEGTTLAEFADELDEVLSTAGLDELQPWRAENIFRTGVQSAYGRGRFEQMTDPDIATEIWGWRYLTVGDDRVREEHAALEGHVFRRDEGDAFFPPWSFNCRCSSEIITVDEAIAEGLEAGRPVPSAVQEELLRSDFTSPAVSYDYRPDLTAFHPALVSQFLGERQERFG